jgi:glutathione synthase/RimK-type ligase-like ATP-grasp enzyme
MKNKKIALMDKYGNNFTEGDNFIGYVKGFLDSGCEVYQLDPYTIDLKKKEGTAYSLSFSENSIFQEKTRGKKKLEEFDIIVDLSDLINYNFSKEMNCLENPLLINDQIRMYESADKRTYIKNYPGLIPRTFVSSKISELEKALSYFSGKMVVKDPFGSCGNSVEKIESGEDYKKTLLEMTQDETFPIVAQEFMDFSNEGTKRVAVIGNPKNLDSYRIIHFYGRKPSEGNWKDNLAQGGILQELNYLNKEEENLCLSVARKSGLFTVGIDIGDILENGKRIPKLIETNSVLSFSANGKYIWKLKEVTDFILSLKK